MLALFAVVLVWQLVQASHSRTLLGDFRAFYCGGATILHGENPYEASPILRCEQIPEPFGLHTARDAIDLPAPFPAYVLGFFALFALMPYLVAVCVWFVLLLACTVAACVFLARLCDHPIAAPLTLVGIAFCVSVLPYGELAPVVLAAIGGGALAMRQNAAWRVLLSLAVIALLPHLALPIFLALLIWERSARIPVLILGVLLLIADTALGGPALAISYFTRVLPNHAASEIGFVTQYSATWLAQAAGASDRSALMVGEISYAFAIAVGVYLAGKLSRTFADPAFLIVIPAALAVTGGSFIHYSEITLALPAALLLYSRARGSALRFAGAAVGLVALPWQSVVTQPSLMVAIVLGAIAIAGIVLGADARRTLRIGVASAVFCAILILVAWRFGPQTAPHALSSAFDPRLAEASWARHISAQTWSSGIVWWIAKMPTWIGLAFIALSGGMCLQGDRR